MPRSSDPALRPAILCRDVVKRFYRYEHRTATLREFFIRSVLRRPINVSRAEFTLSGFNLRVEHGESVALIGPNGSGKSTALRLIAGIYEPSEGLIETYGRRLTAVIEMGSGFHYELTGAENVVMCGTMMGLTRREIADRYPRILEFAEIGHFINEPVKYYSSGMQARLSFSVAACVDPDILLVDEALAVGDQAFRAKCLDFLRAFTGSGGTLVTVSHSGPLVRELCSRGLWLEHGRVVMEGDIESVLAAYESPMAEDSGQLSPRSG